MPFEGFEKQVLVLGGGHSKGKRIPLPHRQSCCVGQCILAVRHYSPHFAPASEILERLRRREAKYVSTSGALVTRARLDGVSRRRPIWRESLMRRLLTRIWPLFSEVAPVFRRLAQSAGCSGVPLKYIVQRNNSGGAAAECACLWNVLLLKRGHASRNLQTALVGSSFTGCRCNYLRNNRVHSSGYGCRDACPVLWSLGLDRRNFSHRRRNQGSFRLRLGLATRDWNSRSHGRLAYLPRTRNNGPGIGHLHRRLGVDDRCNGNCISNQDAARD